MKPSQVTYPWRTTVRTVIQVVVGLAAAMPQIIAAVQGNSGAAATRAAAIALGVSAAISRIMAIPAVNDWLTRFGLGPVPASAARPRGASGVSVPRGAGYSDPDSWLQTSPFLPGPIYNVVRRKANGYDYAYNDSTFFLIVSPDHYWFLLSAGFISVPHGSARLVEDNLLDFIRREASRGLPGADPRVTDI